MNVEKKFKIKCCIADSTIQIQTNLNYSAIFSSGQYMHINIIIHVLETGTRTVEGNKLITTQNVSAHTLCVLPLWSHLIPS